MHLVDEKNYKLIKEMALDGAYSQLLDEDGNSAR
jgi:hypothetical protein